MKQIPSGKQVVLSGEFSGYVNVFNSESEHIGRRGFEVLADLPGLGIVR